MRDAITAFRNYERENGLYVGKTVSSQVSILMAEHIERLVIQNGCSKAELVRFLIFEGAKAHGVDLLELGVAK